MEVRPSGDGFAVEGFRATPAGQGRFVLAPGMTADQLRRTVYSVEWDDVRDETRGRRAFLAAVRDILDGPTERIEVWLDRPNGRAAIVRYTIRPTRFSHFGLLRYLRTVMGNGRVIQDSDRQLEILFRREREPVTCWFQADLIDAGDGPRWSLQYVLTSAAIQPVLIAAPASQPATREALEWHEPPAVPAPTPATELEWKTLDDLRPPPNMPADLDWQEPSETAGDEGPESGE